MISIEASRGLLLHSSKLPLPTKQDVRVRFSDRERAWAWSRNAYALEPREVEKLQTAEVWACFNLGGQHQSCPPPLWSLEGLSPLLHTIAAFPIIHLCGMISVCRLSSVRGGGLHCSVKYYCVYCCRPCGAPSQRGPDFSRKCYHRRKGAGRMKGYVFQLLGTRRHTLYFPELVLVVCEAR